MSSKARFAGRLRRLLCHPLGEWRPNMLDGQSRISAESAVFVGVLWGNLPLVAIVVAPIGIAISLGYREPWPLLGLMFGAFLPAYLWWKVSVSRWHQWALRRGADPERLQKLGEQTQLLWPAQKKG